MKTPLLMAIATSLRLRLTTCILAAGLFGFRPALHSATAQTSGGAAPATFALGHPYISNYGPKDYKGTAQVWSIVQDKQGIMYFGTQPGLAEYDGVSWKSIQLGRAGQLARSSTMDSAGRIYIGAVADFGYLRRDAYGESNFVSLLDKVPPEYRDFDDIFDTSVSPGGIFFNASRYIFLYLPEEDTVRIFQPKQASFHGAGFVNGNYYAREWGVGLTRLEGDAFRLVPGGERWADERIYVMLPYDDEKILFGVRGQGLFLFDGETFVPFRTEIDEELKNATLYLPGAVLPNGHIALNTIGDGVFIIDREGRLIQRITKSTGLRDDFITYVYVDQEGALWIATSNGISRFEASSPFTFYDDRNGINSSVLSITRFKDRMYIGSEGGLSVLNPGTAQALPVEGAGSQIFGLLGVDDQLLAANNLGVQLIEGNRAVAVLQNTGGGFNTTHLHRSGRDPDLVFAGVSAGVVALRRQSDKSWRNEGLIGGINFQVWQIAEDVQGRLWLSTQSQGLFQVTFPDWPSIDNPKIIRFQEEQGWPVDGLLTIIGDEFYGNSIEGIVRWSEAGQRFVRDTTLARDATFAFPGRSGEIWYAKGVSSGLGLATREADGSFTLLEAPFRMLSEEFVNAIFQDPVEDIVWIGTSEGVVRYDRGIGGQEELNLPILLRRVTAGDSTALAIGAAGDVELDYALRRIHFEYALPFFLKEHQTQYRTWLEGLEQHWSPWSSKSDREYLNLPPGPYTFHVRARNITGQESPEATYSFTILAPWYRSAWAIALYILAAGLFVWGVVRLRTRQLKEKHEVLEKLVEERTGEIRQRVQELSMINSVQQGLVAEIDMQGIYDLVGEKIRGIFDAQVVVIRTFNTAAGQEEYPYCWEKGQRLGIHPRPFDGFSRHLLESREPVLINRGFASYISRYSDEEVLEGEMPKSAIFVPMIVGDVVKGNLSLQNVDHEGAFTESDLRLLSTLTNSMSVALENARLFDETTRLLKESQQRAAELATVNNISTALASQLDTDVLIHVVGDQMRDLFKANIVYLALLDKKSNMINFPYSFGDDIEPIAFGEGLTSQIIRSGESMLINKDLSGSYQKLGIERKGKEAASYLGVPIPAGGEIIGVLSVQSTEQENRFNDDDKRLLSTIATHVGVAMHNARLFEQTLKAQAEAVEARKIAEEANEAKSAFLSTVSHELRTPLTSVIGFAKIIRKRLSEKIFPLVPTADRKIEQSMEQVSQNLEVVVSEGERLTNLINDVLDLAKIEAGKMEWHMDTVEVDKVIQQALAATSAMFEAKGLRLRHDIAGVLPAIRGDRNKLVQVMINLLSNATKFTDQGEVLVRAAEGDGEIVVRVTDTGMGIADQDKDKVFEKFKQVGDTLTDKPKGTGLGLPICKEIIEYHGGRLWLESELGKGSTFFFSLPLTTDAEGRAPLPLDDLVKQLKEQVFSTSSRKGTAPRTILVADDEAHIRNLLRQELTESGYEVLEAADGKEALDAIRRQHPDLVILDVMMPEMNGFDVAAVLKNDPATMDIPILILSIVQDKERGFRLGVDRYLTKPIDTQELFQEIGTLLEQGKSKRKVMVVDEDASTLRTLAEVLQNRGYQVVESNGMELIQKAIDSKPDIILLNSVLSKDQEAIRTLRFEKGLENVLFLMYQGNGK
jgi:signal transduction histidine kinase/CheY-like chemotaxis protein